MIRRAASSGVPLSTMAVLMLSVFTVSMGLGVVLPVLSYLIERLPARVSTRRKFPAQLAC
jgi:hypothetical protein